MTKYYLIEEKELFDLLRTDLKFTALESGGVDNWEWYGESLGDFITTYAKEMNIDLEEEDFGFDNIVVELMKKYKQEVK